MPTTGEKMLKDVYQTGRRDVQAAAGAALYSRLVSGG
jgi:hypothetical protein